MSTTVVNVRSFPLIAGRRMLPDGVVYIGRAVPRVGLKASPFANPWRLSEMDPRDPDWLRRSLLLGHYHQWFIGTVTTGELDPESLRGRTLACWCSPERCHGDVICEWLEKHPLVPVEGHKIELGVHRQPESDAETASAWPSLSTFAHRFDAKHRSSMQKVTPFDEKHRSSMQKVTP